MAPTTLKQYRQQAAERQKRWREKKKAEGLNRVSIWLPHDAERILHNATMGGGDAKQAAMTAFVSRLLRESVNVTDNATTDLKKRLEAVEAWGLRRTAELQQEVEEHRAEAQRLAAEIGRLESELRYARNRISELKQQPHGKGAATREKPPESKSGAKATEVLAIAKPLREQGMTAKQIAVALNDRGFRTLSGRGQWTTDSVNNLFSRYG